MRKRAILVSPPFLGTTGPGRHGLGACAWPPSRSSLVDPDLYQDGVCSVGVSLACMQQHANTARYFVCSTTGAARCALRVGLREMEEMADARLRSGSRGDAAGAALGSEPASAGRAGTAGGSALRSAKRGGAMGDTVGSTGADPLPVAPAANGSVAVDDGLPIMLEAAFTVPPA